MSVPKLRFKEFDGDWNKNTIGDFVLNYKGGASLKPTDFVEYSKYEVIPKKAISSGGRLTLDREQPTFCTNEFFNSNQNYVVDSEYLITTLRDLVPSGPSIGYIVKYENDKKYLLAQGVYGFRVKNNLNKDFLIQYSNTLKFRLHMQSIMVGSTQVHIRNQDYFSTEIYTPSLVEQAKTTSFLSAVDEKIAQLTQKHVLLNQYKQGMMQKLFSQQIRFKADDGNKFGEWESYKLFDLAKDKTLNNGVFNDQNKVGKGYKLINVLDMYIKRDIDESRLNLLDLDKKEFEKNKVSYGDIFFTRSSLVKEGIAFSNVYLGVSNDITYDGHLIKLSPNLNIVEPKFLNYCLKTADVRKQLIQGGKTATMTTIGQQEVGNTIVNIPCLEEQTKIANFLFAIDQKIEVVAKQIEQAKQWKKGLLQQMFV